MCLCRLDAMFPVNTLISRLVLRHDACRFVLAMHEGMCVFVCVCVGTQPWCWLYVHWIKDPVCVSISESKKHIYRLVCACVDGALYLLCWWHLKGLHKYMWKTQLWAHFKLRKGFWKCFNSSAEWIFLFSTPMAVCVTKCVSLLTVIENQCIFVY